MPSDWEEGAVVLGSITVLLLCQLAGEVVVRLLHLPMPGPVVGMLLLFIGLVVKGGIPEPLARTADGLLSHLSLLFVPAGVGVVVYLGLIREEWLPISAALLLGTLVTIAVTGAVMALFTRGRP